MNADPSAPPADLFNIWRQDYMVSPGEAAAQEQERKANTFFDGVLPPFSNVGNTERGASASPSPASSSFADASVGISARRMTAARLRLRPRPAAPVPFAPPVQRGGPRPSDAAPRPRTVPDTPTIRGLGIAADFSSANPTSAYDTAAFGKASAPPAPAPTQDVAGQCCHASHSTGRHAPRRNYTESE